MIDLPIVGFELYLHSGKLVGELDTTQLELIGSGMYSQERNISFEKTLKKGDYVLLITTYYPDIWTKFTMTIWGKKDESHRSRFSYYKLN